VTLIFGSLLAEWQRVSDWRALGLPAQLLDKEWLGLSSHQAQDALRCIYVPVRRNAISGRASVRVDERLPQTSRERVRDIEHRVECGEQAPGLVMLSRALLVRVTAP